MMLLLLLTAVLFSSGCTQLQVGSNDSTLDATAKVTGRACVGLMTIGLSEYGFYKIRMMQDFEQSAQIWKNRHYKDLIASWGATSRVSEDGQGGKILVYDFSYITSGSYSSSYSGSGNMYNSNSTSVSPRYVPKIAQFFVNNDGIIYSTKTEWNTLPWKS